MADALSVTVSAAVRAEMARKTVKQRAVAERLGISQTQVSRRLSGRVAFNVDELQTIAELLGVPVTTFLATPERAA